MRFPKLIAFAAGVVSATAFAPLDLWPVMPLAFAVLILLLGEARTMWRALGLGYWFGFGQFVLGLNWIATSFTYQAAMPAWLGWLAVVLLSFYLAVYPMLATGAAWGALRLLDRGDGDPKRPEHSRSRATFANFRGDYLTLALFLAAAWIICEWLRATCFTGFAWNPVGVIWVRVHPITYLARLIGTYGLSGMVVLSAGMLLALAGRRWWALVPLVVALIIGFAASGLSVGEPPSAAILRVVQPNIGQDLKWAATAEAANRSRLIALSGHPVSYGPRLLLWPEAAVPQFLEQDPLARAQLSALLGPRDVLLTGGEALVYDQAGNLKAARNTVFAIDAGGRIIGSYDKAHLVPYGEYLPMRPLLSAIGLSRLAPGDLDFQPGPGPRTLTLPMLLPDQVALKVGLQVCYEMIFSGQVIDEANRPDFVFNPSNDAWFGRWGPPQHLAQARLRAVEEDLPIVRSTPTGISAVIDSDGRLVRSLPWRTAGSIDVELPAAGLPTLFSRFGNLLPMLFATLLALAAIASARARR